MGMFRGPMCYDCNHVISPDECTTVRPCDAGEVRTSFAQMSQLTNLYHTSVEIQFLNVKF